MGEMKRSVLLLLLAFLLTPAVARGDTYAVLVGIAQYQQADANLRLPVSDAKAVAAIYEARGAHVTTLYDRQATRSQILKTLSAVLSQAGKDDTVLFFFSGHGGTGYLCPYDMSARKGSELRYTDVAAIYKACTARTKLMFVDACHAGGFRLSARKGPDKAGMSDVLLFLSSRTGETSIESPRMTNGFFTTYLARGLRGGADANGDRKVTAHELFTFVHDGVTDVSADKQHPVMWGNFDDDLVLMDWTDKAKK